jgi:hypothetical protein
VFAGEAYNVEMGVTNEMFTSVDEAQNHWSFFHLAGSRSSR